MATTSFTGVHSFRLKYPQYSSFRKKISSKGEWIELYKNRNELPTAKLRTWVLYYRNDGQWYGSTSPANGNYIFYDKGGAFTGGSATNNDGRQLGWIWGFPLFNVGATATNWPKWGSCLGNTHGFSGGETHGNEKMLVDISQQRNIIVLDFNGYNVDAFSSNAKSTDKIKDNINETGFYLTLRLKSSQENELKDFTTFNGTADNAGAGGYATLVEYIYECDIIGPKDMLDFTLDYFLYLDVNNTKLFGENLTINSRKYKLAHIPSTEANTYHDNLKISIITGLGPDTVTLSLNQVKVTKSLDITSVDVTNNPTKVTITHSTAEEGILTVGDIVTVSGHTGNAANLAVNQSYVVESITSSTETVFSEGTGLTDGTYNTGTTRKLTFPTKVTCTHPPADIVVGNFVTVSGLTGSPGADVNQDYIVSYITSSTETVLSEGTAGLTNGTYNTGTEKIMTIRYWTNNDRLMDTDGIYNDLVYNGTINKVLQKWIGTGNQETINRVTVTKIIGGYYSQMGFSTPSNHIGYYGDNFGSGEFQTRISSSSFTHGWNKNTTLKNKDCDNGVTRTDSTTNPTYNLNNILWCSLNSPRKTKVRIYGKNGKFNYRFVDNYLDLNGIECNGGGYSRFPNTIDLPRNNLKPYYGSVSNSNTISLLKDFNTNVSQYFTDDTQRTLTDIVDNHFKVYYKLLVPPISGESYKIKYTFGKNISITNQQGSKVTFFRHDGMSGTATPPGKSSLNATRDTENIELEWTSSDIDSNNDITKKNIILFDVASGLSLHTATHDITDTSLSNTRNEEVYDLSCNVFQVQSRATAQETISDAELNISLDENPYQEKTFSLTSTGGQYIDISSTPLNYQPFRYINTKLSYIFNANSYQNDISYAPILIQPEGFIYSYVGNYARTDVSTGSEGVKAEILQDSNNIFNVDLYENNTLVLNYDSNVTLTDELFIFFESTNMFDISINSVQLKSLNNENINFLRPFTLNLKNNLIPDYWRLYKPINDYFFNNITEKNIPIEYNYQTTISQILSISNISVNFTDENKKKVKYILLNSNENSFAISALTENNVLATSNIIIDVLGENFIPIKLGPINTTGAENAIIELKCNNNTYNPFGITRSTLIGDRSLPTSNNGGLSVPNPDEPDKRFSMNIPLNQKLSRNNGMEISTDRRIWNNLYDIEIKFWDDGLNGNGGQNKSMNNKIIGLSNLKVLLVNIPNIEYIIPINEEGETDITTKLNSDNTSFELNWKGFEFLQDDVGFNKTVAYGGEVGKKIEIIWSVLRENTTTSEIVTLVNSTSHPNLNYNIIGDDVIYTFIDNSVRIFDKYKYKISGVCRWSGLSDLLLNDGLITQLSDAGTAPSFNINGFVTDEIFICKNNKFPYGRFNTTATNLKLYRPLLLRTVGQRDQFGNIIGGDCSVVQKSRPNVLSDGGSNNNIYINTADQMTRRETFKRLSTLRLNR
tara:strand:+ start:747 stop:5096 length:4350 start_codon:yes stop_codon:yes gene_type:complete